MAKMDGNVIYWSLTDLVVVALSAAAVSAEGNVFMEVNEVLARLSSSLSWSLVKQTSSLSSPITHICFAVSLSAATSLTLATPSCRARPRDFKELTSQSNKPGYWVSASVDEALLNVPIGLKTSLGSSISFCWAFWFSEYFVRYELITGRIHILFPRTLEV